MIGQTISHYRIVDKLGEGGMGVVYLAEDTVLGRKVAIKTLNATRTSANHFRARFLREAQAVSKLSHPHIANIYDYGETQDGEPYIVMELVEGNTLTELMRAGSLTIPRAIQIVQQVAEALSEAHRRGIIHRDIKPSNIAINDRGIVKVLDFGLAKQIVPSDAGNGVTSPAELNTQTREGVIVGTPMYLSPEQALGVEVDARSDLFSLGSVLYECITGRPAFAGNTDADICAKVIRDDPPAPLQLNANVPAELNRVVLKTLAKKPSERYQSADETIAALKIALSELENKGSDYTTRLLSPVSATQLKGARATLSDIFKRPRLSIGYVAAGIVVIALLAFGTWQWSRAKVYQPTPEARQLYEKGVAALREGAFHKASKTLERAVAADEKYALGHARLAETYAELDYPDRAREQMLIAARLVTDRGVLDQEGVLYFDGIQATLARDHAEAINKYEELSKLKPDDASAFADLGRAYENHDEINKAIEQYLRASNLDPTNPAPLLRLGALYGRRQDLPRSSAAFDSAERLYDDDQNFEGTAEVSYQRAYLLSQVGKMAEAKSSAQRSLDVAKLANNPYQQVRALLVLGTIAYSTGETESAQRFISQALDLARNNEMESLATQGVLDLGYALMIRRSYDDSERYLRQGLELAQRYKGKRNEARANLLLGTLYIQKEDADRGAPFIEQALNFYRNGGYRREVSRCMMMVGRAQLLRRDFEDAIKTLDEQFQLAKQVEDPGQLGRSQAEVAAALSKQDLYPQALARYTESYVLNKELKNPLNAAFALLNRGDMLARLGRYSEANEALEELKTFLDLLSDDNNYKHLWRIWSHLIRAQMAFSERDFERAKAECEAVLSQINANNTKSLGTSEAEVKGLLGLSQVYLGVFASGLEFCKEALAIASASPELKAAASGLQLALAEALIEAGNAKAAQGAALEAQQMLASEHRRESEWRAWVIAGRASRHLNDVGAAQDYLTRARRILDGLRSQWGDDAFNSYSVRKDVKEYLSHMATL